MVGEQMDDSRNVPHIQQAVEFFKQAELTRLLELIYEKYIELGRVGGQVSLPSSTSTERRNIASFLGRPTYLEIDIKVSLSSMDIALKQSRFACELADLLNAFFPDRPMITRPQQHAAHKARRADFHSALKSIAHELPAHSQGRHWLLQGQHGLEWLYKRYKNELLSIQEQHLILIRTLALTLNQLPPTSSPERLAVFAQKMSGDPHFFDSDRTAGRLLRYAMADLASASATLEIKDSVALYTSFGLLIDTISSSVAVYNLAHALCAGDVTDPLIQAAGPRVLLLPLRQVLEWQSIVPAARDIFVFENPQVFEEVIAGLTRPHPVQATPPTLICTSGWPSSAALRLLDLLVAQSPDNRLHYSGDFDLVGLKIAAFMLERYAGQCLLWHMDSETYQFALQHGGLQANRQDAKALIMLPNDFKPLVLEMQKQGQWAYQEGIVPILLEDLLH